MGGMVTVSRLEGLLCPSSIGGLMMVSLDVTSKLLLITWNSCLDRRFSAMTAGREDQRTNPCKWKGWKPESQLYTVS